MNEIKINHAAVILPLTEDRRILLQRKDEGYIWNPDMWCLFGGKVEKDESSVQAIGRELSEELGPKIGKGLTNITYFGTRPYFDIAPVSGRRREGNLYAFVANFDGDTSKIAFNEGAGFSLWKPEKIWGLHMVPHNRDLVLEVYRSLDTKFM